MVFRLQSNTFFITYPKCDASLEDLETFLRNRFHDCVYVCVSHETHQDGTSHRHALVKYRTRHDCRERTFDWGLFHPNVQRPENWNAVENYVKKDNMFILWEDRDLQPSNIFEVARMSSYEAFENHCLAEHIPYGWGNAVWAHVNEPDVVPIYDDDPNGDLNLVMPQSLEELSFDVAENTTYLVNGVPGIGKTVAVLRKVPKPVMLVSHLDQLKALTSKVKTIVYDDCSFLHLPRSAQLALVDRYLPHAIHRRYGTSLVPSGTMVVMTSNILPVNTSDPAIARRCKVIEV